MLVGVVITGAVAGVAVIIVVIAVDELVLHTILLVLAVASVLLLVVPLVVVPVVFDLKLNASCLFVCATYLLWWFSFSPNIFNEATTRMSFYLTQ
jgi:hypothetical protein